MNKDLENELWVQSWLHDFRITCAELREKLCERTKK